MLHKLNEFKFLCNLTGLKMAEAFMTNTFDLTHLRTFGQSWGMLADEDAFVFVDNHDNQRGHGGAGKVITFKQSRVSRAMPVE